MKNLLIGLSVLFLLTGCGNREIRGEVLSVSDEGQYLQMLVRTDSGQQVRLLADEHTHVYSFADPEASSNLLSGELLRPVILASDLRRQDGARLAGMICVESLELPEGYTLKDGTRLTVRKNYSSAIYFTPDGTELLREQAPIGPANVHSGTAPSLDALSQSVQDAILSYYGEQGFLYDLDAELEQAYRWYLETGTEESYDSCLVSQEISPAAANDRLVWYTACTTTPVDGNVHRQLRECTIFDRQTGAVIDPATLFSCTEAETAAAILDASGMPDTELRQEMESGFLFEYLTFQSDGLEVCFPAGSLMNHHATDYLLTVRYQDIPDILHPWAIPDTIEP